MLLHLLLCTLVQAFSWPTRQALLAARPQWVTRLCHKVEQNPQKYAFFGLAAGLAVGTLWYKGYFNRSANKEALQEKSADTVVKKLDGVTATVAQGRAEDFGYRAVCSGIKICYDENKNDATLHQSDGWRCGYYALGHALMYLRGIKQLTNDGISSDEYFLALQKYVANVFGYQDNYRLLGSEIERIRDKLYSQFKDDITVLDYPKCKAIETLEPEQIEKFIKRFNTFFPDDEKNRSEKIQHVFICNSTYPHGFHWVAVGVTREAHSQEIKVDWMDSHGNGGAQVASVIAGILQNKDACFAAWKEGHRKRMLISVEQNLNQKIDYFKQPTWTLDSCVEILKDPTQSHGVFDWLKRRFGRSSKAYFRLHDDSDLFLNRNQMKALEQGYTDTYIPNKVNRKLVAKNYSCQQGGVMQYKTEFVPNDLASMLPYKNKKFVYIPGVCERDCARGVDQKAINCKGLCKAGQWQNIPEIEEIYTEIKDKLAELYKLDKKVAAEWFQENFNLLKQKFSPVQISALLDIAINQVD